jgi:hypothetical protein
VVPQIQNEFWGSQNAVNFERIRKHMLKKQSMELIVGVVILPYNSKKWPFIRPSNATELSVL